MPPAVATLLTTVFILFLFRRDARNQGHVAGALWLPVMWLAIIGSRFVSQWIDIARGGRGVSDEGSLIDVVYFLALVVAGLYVLGRRVVVGDIMRNNRWLMAFFIYGFAAVVWSDFPFIALKRWVKTLGHPIMALIILTDPDPVLAFRIVMKRCAYLLIPISVMFIKYYPQYGRAFSEWTGEAYNQGITTQKNALGYLCLIFGVFFFWHLQAARHVQDRRLRIGEYLLGIGLLGMIAWLLHMAQSSTALVAMVLALVTIKAVDLPGVSTRFLGSYIVAGLVFIIAIEQSFNVYQQVLNLLGEDATLTDRTKIWSDCLALVENPILGAGFESFWLPPRSEIITAKWRINQAHNGYLETYLNLGALGVLLLLGVLLSTFHAIKWDLLQNRDFARLRLGFFFAIIAYNYTEAAFKSVHPLWTIFYIIALDVPRQEREAREKTQRPTVRPERWRNVAAAQRRGIRRYRHQRRGVLNEQP